MIAFKDLIVETEYKLVYNCLNNHYKTMNKTRIDKMEIFYDKLLDAIPEQNSKSMYIYIGVFKQDESGDSVYLEDFDENDADLYFDVSGRDDEHCGYSLITCKFESWLGFYIDSNTLLKMTVPNIIAHCLWEMTFCGFEHKRDENGTLIGD